MATFATAATRGTVIDAFVSPDMLQQVARNLALQRPSFRTHIMVSRGLGAGPGETTAPTPQRVRCLDGAPKLDTGLDEHLARAFKRAIGQMMPHARRVSRRALSVFALEEGVTLRLDLAREPALPTDVTLTFICRPGGGAEATLRVWSGPLTGCSQPRAPAVVSLKERQAAVLPA
jgi:hypothetical protein